ncbi:MAG: efflux RND transporter periplasmic adaptor subunit [Saprospiraceae bacterium]|nr:efflux RND transporter periplasmic adaptor subunit [Saprospiraceae bacterium]
MKKIIPLILPLVFVFCKNENPGNSKSADGPPKVTKVEGYIVNAGPFNEEIQIPGTILPFESTDIQSEVSGKIVQLNIKEGAYYSKGALIAKINDEDLQAKLKKLLIQQQIAQSQEKRQSELLKINAIGQQEYDAVNLNYKSIQSDIEILKTEIKKTEIRAPFDGVVGFKLISPGAYVTPLSKITTITQTNRLKLEFSLPERYISALKTGMTVEMNTESTRKSYIAKIFAIEPTLSSDSRSINVRAEIIKPDKFVQPGMFANVKVDVNDKNNVIKIPTQAIIPQARDKKVVLYKGGFAKFQTVTIGIRDESNVEIVDGLTVGDTILVSGLLTAKPDSKLVLTSMKN